MISRIFVFPSKIDKSRDNYAFPSYLISSDLNANDIACLAQALTNSAIEKFSINSFTPPRGYNTMIEVGFRPGVTDNVAHTVQEIVKDIFPESSNVEIYTSKVYLVKYKNPNKIKSFAQVLYNPLIEKISIVKKVKGLFALPNDPPEVRLLPRPPIVRVSLDVSDTELAKIGREGIMDPSGIRRGPLALDLDYMKAIRDYFSKFGRNPTDVELESLAQTWSEHCKHTIFANPIDDIKDGLYKTFIKGATNLIRHRKGNRDFCVSVFSDNAGGIIFDDKYLITHKVETHNTPSALDPYGGAITGIVGVNRDCLGFGLGAKPVANTYGFCFGLPEDTRPLYRNESRTERLFPPKRIMEGVIRGINHGGNCSGIPTPHGFARFDDRFRGKPLVFAGTVGLIPRKIGERAAHEKRAEAGDYIVMLGGRVGADGIHGATFSSVVLNVNSPTTAVQIGDPITQKKFSDALIREARAMNLYNSITDNGAGGLSCSVAEMAKECNGARVDLDKVPLKYPGLRPWEIWISESQERMTLAVPKKKWELLRNLLRTRGVEATVIGEFTDSGKCEVLWGGKSIMNIDLDFLHNGLPARELRAERPRSSFPEPRLPSGISRTKEFEKLIGEYNICGQAFISEQYDHEVQAGSVVKPLTGAGRINTDAQVVAPVLGSRRGVVLSSALYPSYSLLNTYDMALASLDTAVRNAVSAGAKLSHLALLDNFCWCSSNEPKRLGELVEAVRGCYDGAVAYETPFISGKDSMFNDFSGFDEKGRPIKISIPPTLLISVIGVIPDVLKTVTPEFKTPGDAVYLLGETKNELGGSEYYKMLGSLGRRTPKVDLKRNLATYLAVERAIEGDFISSAVSLNSGGLAAALAKACIGGGFGIKAQVPGKAWIDSALFGESQGRILVSVRPENISRFEKIMKGVTFSRIGTVLGSDKITISMKQKTLVDTSIKKLRGIYHRFSDSMYEN